MITEFENMLITGCATDEGSAYVRLFKQKLCFDEDDTQANNENDESRECCANMFLTDSPEND